MDRARSNGILTKGKTLNLLNFTETFVRCDLYDDKLDTTQRIRSPNKRCWGIHVVHWECPFSVCMSYNLTKKHARNDLFVMDSYITLEFLWLLCCMYLMRAKKSTTNRIFQLVYRSVLLLWAEFQSTPTRNMHIIAKLKINRCCHHYRIWSHAQVSGI